ncbi:multiple sugar transport system substrate-binding protein [Cohnella sp. OV330]|uniref:ABC transporter substrate-binding protein n=1 Tax=Cohnella sp. OV330 TaxID=1855288 RepID=UPI0008F2AE10|nr:sugar ABC transporter substrate-binding protein [Cohnella sp. OV330]SFB03092.1 multiple sugar transport system substrate-binding protein [Cohnella sp. OV330]
MFTQSGMKTISKLAVSSVAMALVLSACGGNDNNNSSGASAGASAGSSAGGEKVKLRMIESLTSDTRTAELQKMIDAFEKANSNIDVELISPPFDQADNKIRTMLSAKEDIDIVEARDLNVAEFVNNGYLEPLNEYTKNWSEFSTVTKTALDVGSIGDKLYFISNGLYQRQMFYRADWLKDAGIAVPKTYQELVDASIKLTDKSKNRYGFSFRGGPGANSVPDTMVLAYNGANVNTSDAMFLNDGKSIYSSPEAKQALDLYLKLFKEGSPADSVGWGFSEQVQAFTSGVTAFLLQDPDVINTLKDGMEEGTWATAPMPTGPSGVALISAGGAGWGITSFSTKKEAAWKLIEFLSSNEQNVEWSKSYGTIPIHSTATEDAYFNDGPYKTLLDMTADPKTFVNYKPPFNYPANSKFGTVSMETGQQMLLGKASVEETLAKWDKFWIDAKAELDAK